MNSTSTFKAAHNPLRHLPSVMALPTLNRRMTRVQRHIPLGEDDLVALLKLDPMATIRGLRAASTVVFKPKNELPTHLGIVRSLGRTLTRRLFHTPGTTATDDPALTELWHHAIATGHAASRLAQNTVLIDPEVAYLLGLVHDLPEWLLRIERQHTGEENPAFQPIEWILNWQLPAPFVSQLLAIDMRDKASTSDDPPDVAGLIRAAELLADLAGFQHPNPPESSLDPTVGLDAAQMAVSRDLDREVQASLRQFGFAPDVTDTEIAAETPATDEAAGTDEVRSHLDEVIVSILNCTRSESYRGIVTAATAAAVRYGNYDRAFYAKWQRQTASLKLRSKADSSSRRMQNTSLQTSAEETAALNKAIELGTPVHLSNDRGEMAGLLGMLSTDELLAIPLNTDFETPAFLLLDRSLTLLPIDLEKDMTLATMLGMTGSLLVENLLLRRRRQRAQKFALTDPLTRLFNRRMGMHALEQSIARTARDGSPLTVLMCDLDHFKRLNDTLGHVRGDAALRATADVLRTTVRKSDTVCRYGGEEFLVVLPDTTPDEATVLAARMFTAVQARGESLGLPTTISIGLTSYRKDDSLESMLMRADHALYASKDSGRNRFSADIEDDEYPEPALPAGSAPATPAQEGTTNEPRPGQEPDSPQPPPGGAN